MKPITLLLCLLFAIASFAQDISGRWTTIDDNTGAKRSVVEITVVNGIATGHIVDIHDKTKLEKVCDKCTDDRNGQRILGLPIIRNMQKDGNEWEDGTNLDPENGKVYDCKMWLEDGKLMVRGYVAFFYRTQVWVR